MPDTAPTPGQVLVGATSGAQDVPRVISGGGATITMAATGVLTIDNIANASLANSAITIGGTSTALGGAALGNVTNDTQTKAAIMPNTVPTSAQLPIGNATQYIPRSITGDVTVSATGVTTVGNVANSALAGNGTMTITGDVVALGGTLTQDQITGISGLSIGYAKHTAANTLSAVASIPNADLTNNSITVGNASAATALGGSVSADAIYGGNGPWLRKTDGSEYLYRHYNKYSEWGLNQFFNHDRQRITNVGLGGAVFVGQYHGAWQRLSGWYR